MFREEVKRKEVYLGELCFEFRGNLRKRIDDLLHCMMKI